MVSFSGNSFMMFETPSSLESTTTNITIIILPYKENGVIFYGDRKRGDFIGLAIKNSYLEYRLVQYDGTMVVPVSLTTVTRVRF